MSEKPNSFNIESVAHKSKNDKKTELHFPESNSLRITAKLIELMLNDKEDSKSLDEKFRVMYIEIENEIIEKDIRLLYSEITKEMYKIDLEKRNIVSTNMEFLNQIYLGRLIQIENKVSDYTELIRKNKLITKIYDHFALSLAQIDRIFTEIQSSESNLTRLVSIAKDSVIELKSRTSDIYALEDKSRDLEKRFDRINFDVISILGVFTGISFILFGGLSLLSNINMGSNYNLLIKSIIIGMILIDCITILLQYIRSIVDPSNIRVLNLVKNPFTNKLTLFVTINVLVWTIIMIFIMIEYRTFLEPIWNDILLFINFHLFEFNVKNILLYVPVWLVLILVIFLLLVRIIFGELFAYKYYEIKNLYFEYKYRKNEG